MMKFTSSHVCAALVIATMSLVCIRTASAVVILTIDISDPANVAITATTGASSITDSSATNTSGVTLEDLFTSNFSALQSMTGDLKSAQNPTNVPYDASNNGFASVSLTDLNIYDPGASQTQNFTSGLQAFSGQAVLDLTGAPFQPVGYIGNVRAGDGNAPSSFAIIGEFQIVPEPASVALACLGVGLMLLSRRRSI